MPRVSTARGRTAAQTDLLPGAGTVLDCASCLELELLFQDSAAGVIAIGLGDVGLERADSRTDVDLGSAEPRRPARRDFVPGHTYGIVGVVKGLFLLGRGL